MNANRAQMATTHNGAMATDDVKQHAIESFALRVQRLSDTRFFETSTPLGGSVFGNEEAVFELSHPYLVPVLQTESESNSAPPSVVSPAPAVCLATYMAHKQDTATGVWCWQCKNVPPLLVSGPAGTSPMAVYFHGRAWPIHTGFLPSGKEARSKIKPITVCLPHACALFKLKTQQKSPSNRPDWLPPVCRMYDSWVDECGLARTMPLERYKQQSGELIREAARQCSSMGQRPVSVPPLFKNNSTTRAAADPKPHLRRRSSASSSTMEFDSGYPNNDPSTLGARLQDIPEEQFDTPAENPPPRDCTYATLRACECVAGCLVTVVIPVYDFASWVWTRHYCCCPATGQNPYAQAVPRARQQWYRKRGLHKNAQEEERLMRQLEEEDGADAGSGNKSLTSFDDLDADRHPYQPVSDTSF